MLWNAVYKPILRPVEAIAFRNGQGPSIEVRDRSGLSNAAINLSGTALQILSWMDGQHSCEDIRRQFADRFGRPLSENSLLEILQRLDNAHFLQGPRIKSDYQSLQSEYRKLGVRHMRNADALDVDEQGSLFASLLADAPIVDIPGKVVGLVAPHLDFLRGGPCYAVACRLLRVRPIPRRVVNLGTNHFGLSSSIVATTNDFCSPLGRTCCDRGFIGRLEKRCGNLRACELDHPREHSIELQVTWLQYMFGSHDSRIVSILCPDPCGLAGTAPYERQGIDLRKFALHLGELVAADGEETLIIAGADLSHVGVAFGDERPLDEDFLGEVERRDRAALQCVERCDGEVLVACLCGEQNPTRVCSAGCLLAISDVMTGATGHVLKYHQAVDQAMQVCVTCAAVVFTQSEGR